MTAFNSVRMKVKPGRKADFLAANKRPMTPAPTGLRKFSVVKTGDLAYCMIGERDSMAALVAARPAMIGQLDAMRGMLDDLGGGLGVTDPVSGEAVIEI